MVVHTVKWFERKFDFSFGNDQFDAIYKRLRQSPATLRELSQNIEEHLTINKPEGKWSVKEHIGHLSILEPLWRTRMLDIQHHKPVLTPTDLENKATTKSGFNKYSISSLLDRFAAEREKTLLLLHSVDSQQLDRTSLHPRMKQPMCIIDIAYFTAEHDDHHIQYINKFIERQSPEQS